MKKLLLLISLITSSFPSSIGCKNQINMYLIAQSQGENRKNVAMHLINTGECKILNYVSKSDIKKIDGYLAKVKVSNSEYWVIASTIK